LPLHQLKSRAVVIVPEDKTFSAARIESELRKNEPPVIARIEEDKVLMDMRTVQEEDYGVIVQAVASAHAQLLSDSMSHKIPEDSRERYQQ
jgi:L-seryl-tRNA(Ser) seleniumtransferase